MPSSNDVGGRHRRPDRQRVVFTLDGPRRVDRWQLVDGAMRALGYVLIFACGVVLLVVLAQVMTP